MFCLFVYVVGLVDWCLLLYWLFISANCVGCSGFYIVGVRLIYGLDGWFDCLIVVWYWRLCGSGLNFTFT